MAAQGTAPSYPYGKAILGTRMADGSSYGPFQIEARLSVTLFGMLYRAQAVDGSRLLWIFPDTLFRDRGFSGKLKTGVTKIREQAHPQVLMPIELKQIKGHWCLVFDDPGGATLSTYLQGRNGEPNTPDEVRFFLTQTVEALKAMAAVGLSHRQITPDLMLITAEGRVVVLGFGWFEAVDRTRFEQFISTAIIPISEEDGPVPHFTALDVLSPELRNGEHADVRADIFTLGLLAHYLLVGQRAERDWTPPSHLRPELKKGWDAFVRRCLESEPQDRYASASAFLEALENVENLRPKPVATPGKLGRRLEAIPLPRQVTARYNADTLLKLRLVLLGLFGLVVVGLGRLSFDILYHGPPPIAGPPAVRVSDLTLADAVLRIQPAWSRVMVAGENEASFTVNDGVIGLELKPGRHEVTVEARLHRPRVLRLNTAQAPIEQHVDLALAWGQLSLTGYPGTVVEAVAPGGERRFVGTLGEDGTLVPQEKLFAATYNLAASLPGFQPLVFEGIELSANRAQALDVTLPPIPPILEVRSRPNGAQVLIGGEVKGTTPLAVEGLPMGEPLLVELTYPGLRRASRSVTLGSGARRLLDFGDLEIRSGGFDLAVTLGGEPLDPELIADLVVSINDVAYTANPQLSLNLQVGVYQVVVRHPQLFPFEQNVVIADNAQLQLAADLRPRPGRLTITLPTDGRSRFVVDGQTIQPAADGAYELPHGRRVEVALELVDHFVERASFTLEPNERYNWRPQMRRIPGPERGEDYTLPYQRMAMVWLEAGSFTMGSPGEEANRRPDEGPRTVVRLGRGFWIGAYEVTQRQFTRLMGENPSEFEGPRRPVENVTTGEAAAFAERLTAREREAGRLPDGYIYRLPTEAEWEYAARAGTGTPFFFGARANQDDGQFSGVYPRVFVPGPGEIQPPTATAAIGSFAPNDFGLYDVHGNVAELTAEAFHDRHLGGRVSDPARLFGGRGVAIRGGSWQDRADRCRAAARGSFDPRVRSSAVGFRLVLAPPITLPPPPEG